MSMTATATEVDKLLADLKFAELEWIGDRIDCPVGRWFYAKNGDPKHRAMVIRKPRQISVKEWHKVLTEEPKIIAVHEDELFFERHRVTCPVQGIRSIWLRTS